VKTIISDPQFVRSLTRFARKNAPDFSDTQVIYNMSEKCSRQDRVQVQRGL